MSGDVGAPEGNSNAMLWPTPEARRAACERLCVHLRSGLSMDCFSDADGQTIKRYMRDFPIDFDPDRVRAAMRDSRKFWEMIGVSGTMGKIKGFQPASWKFNMQNRLGWKDNLTLGNDPDNPLPENKEMKLTIVRVSKGNADASSDS